MGGLPFWLSYGSLWVLVLALGCAVFALYRVHGEMLVSGRAGRHLVGPTVGERVSARRMQDATGGWIDIGRPDGRPQLIFFSAPKCKLCADALPALRQFASMHVSDVHVILVSQGTPRDIADLAAKFADGVSIVSDPVWEIGGHWHVSQTPLVCLTDKDGIIRGKGAPSSLEGLESLLALLEDGDDSTSSASNRSVQKRVAMVGGGSEQPTLANQ